MPSILIKIKRLRFWRRKRATFWPALLPIELQIKLLLTVASQTDGLLLALLLGRAVPELGKLILAVFGPGTPPKADKKNTIRYVGVSGYAVMAQRDDRPVKLFFISLQEPSLFPSNLLDGGPHSLLTRYIPRGSVAAISSPAEHLSCLMLAPRKRQLQVEPKISSLEVDFADLKNHTIGPLRPLRVLDRCACGLTDQKFKWEYLIENGSRVLGRSLVIYNCPGIHIVSQPSTALESMAIHLNGNTTDWEDGNAQTVCVTNCPRRLLHITFESSAVPFLELHGYHTSLANSTFTLQNLHWSYSNPYGLTKHNDLGLVEMDQATYNNSRVHWGRLDRCMLSNAHYKTLRFYGVPDLALIDYAADYKTYRIFWWRLSPATTGVEGRGPVSNGIMTLLVYELHIVSVIKKNDRLPRFDGLFLQKLVLISLHDSDVAWCPGDLFGYLALDNPAPLLGDVYLERRTDPEREPPMKLAMGTRHLSAISPAVKRLHVRGYVPEFAMAPADQVNFEKLEFIMLDVSEISSELGQEEVILSLGSDRFPVLIKLVLMCTSEAHSNDTLSNVSLNILVGERCNRVYICHLLRPKSLTLNRQLLTVDEVQYKNNPRCETPIIPSRKSQLWERSEDEIGPFAYSGEQLLRDGHFDEREY